jgi:DNA-binding FadR family transcriptional regulator
MSIFEKKTTSQAIVDHILTQIQTGELKQGDKLPTEREMSEQLGVSRVSVREALSGLSTLGILESRQGSGSYVSGYDTGIMGRVFYAYAILGQTPLTDILVARRALEAECARYAARNITEEELARMEAILAEYDEALQLPTGSRGSLAKIQSLDYAFHSAVASASHQSYLIQLVSTVSASFQALHEKCRQDNVDMGQASASAFQRLHKQLLAALRARDEEQAYRIMYAHMTDIETRLS